MAVELSNQDCLTRVRELGYAVNLPTTDPHGMLLRDLSNEELRERAGWCMLPAYHDAIRAERARRASGRTVTVDRAVRIARLAAVYAVEAMAKRGGHVDGADVCRLADLARDAVDSDDKLRLVDVRTDDPTVIQLPARDAGLMSTTDGLLPGRHGDAA
ncbi:MAG TPA: hypothetical protein VK631_22200 [Solirubrobacteraceae bacterium]|nr:hypothetical protein [Solirubrobacteraceae bacterium]